VISSIAWRAGPARRPPLPASRRNAGYARPAARARAVAKHRRAAATPRARPSIQFTLAVRSDALGPAAGGLAVLFLVALAYLRFVTSVAVGGYDVHQLEARRDEVRREVQLLQLELSRLDAPMRIEAEAKRLGLEKVASLRYIAADPLVAGR
jgi:hypothetical protein